MLNQIQPKNPNQSLMKKKKLTCESKTLPYSIIQAYKKWSLLQPIHFSSNCIKYPLFLYYRMSNQFWNPLTQKGNTLSNPLILVLQNFDKGITTTNNEKNLSSKFLSGFMELITENELKIKTCKIERVMFSILSSPLLKED